MWSGKPGVSFTVVETAAGFVAFAHTARGLHTLVLPQRSARAARLKLQQAVKAQLIEAPDRLGIARALQRYFCGGPARLRCSLDLTRATPFQRAVWRVLQGIPPGRTRSYGEVARAIGRPRAARAVGQAVGANPLPLLIPCHRVVGSRGALGGFAWGSSWKRRLLAIEGTLSPTGTGRIKRRGRGRLAPPPRVLSVPNPSGGRR